MSRIGAAGPSSAPAVWPNHVNPNAKKRSPLVYPMRTAERGATLHHDAMSPANAKGVSHHHPVSGKARCRTNAHTSATAVGSVVPSGYTQIQFETQAQPDFTNYKYLIVLNANGDGHAPYALGYNSNYTDWSFAFFFGGGAGLASAPIIYQYFSDSSQPSGVNKRTLGYATGTLTFNLLSATSAAAYGFYITFNRCLLDYPSPINNTGVPTPAPTSHPQGQSCPPFYYLTTDTWVMNMFSIDSTNTVFDSLGNGPSDTSYAGFTINTDTLLNGKSYIKPVTGQSPQNPSAAIYGVQVFSTP